MNFSRAGPPKAALARVFITDIDNQGPNTVKLKGRSKMLKVLIGLLLMSYAIPTYVYHIDWIFLNVRKMPIMSNFY